jgi:hypothetical protein
VCERDLIVWCDASQDIMTWFEVSHENAIAELRFDLEFSGDIPNFTFGIFWQCSIDENIVAARVRVNTNLSWLNSLG